MAWLKRDHLYSAKESTQNGPNTMRGSSSAKSARSKKSGGRVMGVPTKPSHFWFNGPPHQQHPAFVGGPGGNRAMMVYPHPQSIYMSPHMAHPHGIPENRQSAQQSNVYGGQNQMGSLIHPLPLAYRTGPFNYLPDCEFCDHSHHHGMHFQRGMISDHSIGAMTNMAGASGLQTNGGSAMDGDAGAKEALNHFLGVNLEKSDQDGLTFSDRVSETDSLIGELKEIYRDLGLDHSETHSCEGTPLSDVAGEPPLPETPKMGPLYKETIEIGPLFTEEYDGSLSSSTNTTEEESMEMNIHCDEPVNKMIEPNANIRDRSSPSIHEMNDKRNEIKSQNPIEDGTINEEPGEPTKKEDKSGENLKEPDSDESEIEDSEEDAGDNGNQGEESNESESSDKPKNKQSRAPVLPSTRFMKRLRKVGCPSKETRRDLSALNTKHSRLNKNRSNNGTSSGSGRFPSSSSRAQSSHSRFARPRSFRESLSSSTTSSSSSTGYLHTHLHNHRRNNRNNRNNSRNHNGPSSSSSSSNRASSSSSSSSTTTATATHTASNSTEGVIGRYDPRTTKLDLLRELDRKGSDNFDFRKLNPHEVTLRDLLENRLVNQLSRHKFGSRLLQKCVESSRATQQDLRDLCSIILQDAPGLCQHLVGYFLIQKLIGVTCERAEQHIDDAMGTNQSRSIAVPLRNERKNGGSRGNKRNGTNYSHSRGGSSSSDVRNNRSKGGGNNNRGGSMTQKEAERSLSHELKMGARLGKRILERVFIGNVYVLSQQEYSCRIIQQILKYRYSEYLAVKLKILREIDSMDSLEEFIRHPFGNHVVQKSIEYIPSFYLDKICKNISTRAYQWSVHIYGCRVIQRLLSHCNERQTRSLYRVICREVIPLSKNSFGNYVVQHVLSLAEKQKDAHGFVSNAMSEVVESIAERIAMHVQELSCHKFSSNVVEKCLRSSQSKVRQAMIDGILKKRDFQTLSSSSKGGRSSSSRSTRLSIKSSSKSVQLSKRRNSSGSTPSSSSSATAGSSSDESSQYLVVKMVQDAYGNYVLQTVFEVCNSFEKRVLVGQIQRYVPKSVLLKLSWGKHILTKIDLMMKSSRNSSNNNQTISSNPPSASPSPFPPNSNANGGGQPKQSSSSNPSTSTNNGARHHSFLKPSLSPYFVSSGALSTASESPIPVMGYETSPSPSPTPLMPRSRHAMWD